LLNRTVETLQGNRPNEAFVQSLNARALSIQPDNRQANMQRGWLRMAN
jgi:hypothetical protein